MQALKTNRFISANSLQVGLSLGWVTLMGEVESAWQRQLVETVVAGIDGVKGVINRIAIKPFEPQIHTLTHSSDRCVAHASHLSSTGSATRKFDKQPKALIVVKRSEVQAQDDSDQDIQLEE